MGFIILPSENSGNPLNLSQGEAAWALFRAAVPVTIASDVLTVPGTGRYKISPQSGTTDQITSIVVTQENVDGVYLILSGAAANNVITIVNAGSLHLQGTFNIELNGTRTSVALRGEGGNVFHQASQLVYIP